MSHVSDLDRFVWSRFFERIQIEARQLPEVIDQFAPQGFGDTPQADFSDHQGTDIDRLTTVRQGQQLFRSMVLGSYNSTCAITGIRQSEFLVAGHIRPWSADRDNRMNPRNGLCLNRLHDKAFEDGLIAIENDGTVLYSDRLERLTREKMKRMNDSGKFLFPSRFKPDLDFLKEHRETRFRG